MLARLLPILFLFIASIVAAQTTTIYFRYNNSELSEGAKMALDKLADNRNLKSIGIFGHSDQRGTPEYNEWLSYQRAKAVKDYLLFKGLNRNRIGVVRGFGATRLVINKRDSISMSFNRRVAITNNYEPTALDSAIAARQAQMNFQPTKADSIQFVATTTTPGAPKVITQKTEPEPPAIIKKEAPVVKQQKSEKLIEDIKDKNTKVGENIVLKNINFHPGSHYFLETALAPLQDLLETMQKVPTLEIEIQGHVCCSLGDEDALDIETNKENLSFTRARAVYDFLVEKGIDKKRLTYKGLAHQFPLIKEEETEEDRIANRRVEIKIIKK